MKTTVHVETIGYFWAENIENTTTSPDSLNGNQKYITNTTQAVPYINLNLDVPLYSEDRNNFKSLLNHISRNGWPKSEKPDVVTDQKVLNAVAVGADIPIRLTRIADIIFMWIEKENQDATQKNYEAVFKNFFTKNTEEKAAKCSKKAIFQSRIAGVPFSNILYSGEVDAIDASNQHYNFKVIRSATNTLNFWENKSAQFFWDSVFGNISTLVVGTRTGEKETDPKTRDPLFYPELSIYKLEKFSQETLPLQVAKFAARPRSTFQSWSIIDGEARLKDFFKLIKSTVTTNGDYFVYSQKEEKSIVEKLNDEGDDTRNFILQSIPN
ncbi:hypothetical protein GCK72_001625 [Caenorhabditis remanei]|uniref:Decapping nuclease n=1 Tax=Caenorhabditis remanei TaxID=31234 RepID=A0A6A5HPG4_CAERE|nr:hypothetical protein GCK72_001625 [Caenorhabditis remanei]KAF1769808.1 hypothetical protein GCK72_001625 [Caenorhabditis remanei]